VEQVRPLTALVVDIVRYTALGERLQPNALKDVAGELLTNIARTVEQFGGTVQSFRGDCVAAVFGVPTVHEDDAERALRSGLQILNLVREYAREIDRAWQIPEFNVRIGVATGEVAVDVESSDAVSALALADAMKAADALQAAAEPGAMLVAGNAAQRVQGGFRLQPAGHVRVSGRRRRQPAWRVVGLLESPRRPTVPIVGRDAELAELDDALERLTSAGRGKVLLISGDGGLGKSRLLAELRNFAEDRATWLEGHCVSYPAGRFYGPLTEMMRGWIGVEENEHAFSVRVKLRARLQRVLNAQLVPEIAPYLGLLLSSAPSPEQEDESTQRLTPRELAAEVRRSFCTLVASLTQRGPVVLALEDIHRADSATREVAEALLELTDREPLLLVATLRSDPSSEGWALRVRALTDYVHRTSEVRLAPLSEE
jgi:class 3 adenylate cyclase